MKKKFFIIDTSVVLSGKPIVLDKVDMITTPAVPEEMTPGSLDYVAFQLLHEKGLIIRPPSEESKDEIIKATEETGDRDRLSPADIEILALALDINKDGDEAVILTDDYSIQNVANTLNIKFQGFSQKEITKKFKWLYRCPGCKKQFKEPIKICPICGTRTKMSISYKKTIK
jgi:UPF0271 protein